MPEFLYEPMYDDEPHRFMALGLTTVSQWWVQKGIRERLLCGDCEHLLNERYEKAFAKFYREELLTLRADSPARLTVTVDYRLVRMLLLSILWRAHVAEGPIWHQVKLPAKHAERIRLMLLDDDVGDPSQYQCLVHMVEYRSAPYVALLTPLNGKLRGDRVYMFNFGGFAWTYRVESKPNSDWDVQALSPTGQLTIIVRRALDDPYHQKVHEVFRDEPPL